MSQFVTACGIGENSYQYRAVSSSGNPIQNSTCNVTLMNNQIYQNRTNASGWVSYCINSSSAINNTVCYSPRNQNAIISDVKCADWTYFGDRYSMSFKLTNNLGEPLEAQDCYLRVYNQYGFLVEDLGTNLLYDNQTFIDSNGNYVRTAGVPLSSSMGYYAYAWDIRSKNDKGYTLYRPNMNYTVRAECNSRAYNCSFQVVNKEPMNFDSDTQYLIENMEVVTFGIVILVLGLVFGIPILRRSLFGH